MTKYFWLLYFLPLLWISCTDKDMIFDIGSDKLDVKTRMGYIDTFTVRSYTVMLDSIPTSGLDNPSIVVGTYEDDEFGTISASSFFRLSLPTRPTPSTSSSYYGLPSDATFDSLSFYLIQDGYYAGDTTKPFTLNIHRLAQPIQPNDDYYFYNHDSIACEPDIIGQVVFRPSPISNDTVWVKMDSVLGSELYSLMKQNNAAVTQEEFFYGYFKGISIHYDKSDKAVLGFKMPPYSTVAGAPTMRLYYHYFTSTTIVKHFDFVVDQVPLDVQDLRKLLQFNRFTLRHPRIIFPGTQTEKLPASSTNNRSFVHAGLGIVTRIEVPYLKNLYYLRDNVRVLDAVLELEPVNNTYFNFLLPQKISVFSTDNINRWGSIIPSRTNSQNAVLKTDMVNQEDTYYTFDITNYMIEKLAEQTDAIPAMLLTISVDDMYRKTERLILGSQKNSINKVKLKLYFMNIE